MKGRYPFGSLAIIGVLVVAVYTIAYPAAGSSLDEVSRNLSGSNFNRPAATSELRHTTLIFYNVKNGKVRKSVYAPGYLSANAEITVDGYVAGIVALSDAELDIYKDKIRMHKVSWQKDGTLYFDHFGKLSQTEMDTPPATSRDSELMPVNGYSFFPKIAGDAVSPENRFMIDIQKNGKQTAVAVRQNGYRRLGGLQTQAGDQWHRYRYIGDRLSALNTHLHDFEDRLRAIDEGISEVENIFQAPMVRNVNFVDYEGIQNALTRAGFDDIWFFVETFQNEPVAELRTIARHEVFHLLVDRYDFTQSAGIRKLFADLKGYGDLSLERFLLVTRGIKSGKGSESEALSTGNRFFEFINEKNIIAGAKGGHSQDNLDEFCTSFLHSLLYPGQIKLRLNQPLNNGSRFAPCYLQINEKREILSKYREMIGHLLDSLDRSRKEPIESLLEKDLTYIENLQNDFSWARDAPPGVHS